jgi:hypothetical protein
MTLSVDLLFKKYTIESCRFWLFKVSPINSLHSFDFSSLNTCAGLPPAEAWVKQN